MSGFDVDQAILGEELEHCVPYHEEDYGACAVSLYEWAYVPENLSFENARMYCTITISLVVV